VTVAGILFLIVYAPIAIRLGIEGEVDYVLFNEIENSQNIDLSPLRRGIRWLNSI